MGAIRKFIVALVAAIAEAVSLGLVPDAAGKWLAVAVAFLAAIGVAVARNDPTPGLGVGPIRNDG